MEYPDSVNWYLCASSSSGVETSEGTAVAVRLRRKSPPESTETFLLTCAHVVRRSRDSHGELGRRHDSIHALPAGVGYRPKGFAMEIVETVVPLSANASDGFYDHPVDDIEHADWVLLRFVDEARRNQPFSGSVVADWGSPSAGDQCLVGGYPGGHPAFSGFDNGNDNTVRPQRRYTGDLTKTDPISRVHDGLITLDGQDSRRGMSGGAVFRVKNDQFCFVGIHRARHDVQLQLKAVSAEVIRTILDENGYEPVEKPAAPDGPRVVSGGVAESVDPFLSLDREMVIRELAKWLFPRLQRRVTRPHVAVIYGDHAQGQQTLVDRLFHSEGDLAEKLGKHIVKPIQFSTSESRQETICDDIRLEIAHETGLGLEKMDDLESHLGEYLVPLGESVLYSFVVNVYPASRHSWKDTLLEITELQKLFGALPELGSDVHVLVCVMISMSPDAKDESAWGWLNPMSWLGRQSASSRSMERLEELRNPISDQPESKPDALETLVLELGGVRQGDMEAWLDSQATQEYCGERQICTTTLKEKLRAWFLQGQTPTGLPFDHFRAEFQKHMRAT